MPVRDIGIVPRDGDALGNPVGVEAPHPQGGGGVADVDDLQAGVPVRDIGIVPGDGDVPGLPGGVDVPHPNRGGGVAEVDDIQPGAAGSGIRIATFHRHRSVRPRAPLTDLRQGYPGEEVHDAAESQ